uniref:DUF1841 domain-containing protein n=1 Tax=uncultured Thiotrichaceae bacterium TaxID=298394 RepID=A0A6S6UHY2_9GAMM|nr:MAG: Unknown protein [uncultured Thiotrichaceae bacterium]
MISNDREQLRRYYLRCWQKLQADEKLDGLEEQVAEVIKEHPEYHAQLQDEDTALSQDYHAEDGGANPFLHMSLHLGLREQIVTDRPAGVQMLYQQLIAQIGVHEAEHRMMQCLSESIWLAQQNKTAPDEALYFDCLKECHSL